MRLVDVLCGRLLFPSSPANFQNVFKNRCFFGFNLFCDSKIWVTNCSFLRSTGFPLLYARILIIFLKIAVVSLSFQEQLIDVFRSSFVYTNCT